MSLNKEFLVDFLSHYDYPKTAVDAYLSLCDTVLADKDFADRFNGFVDLYNDGFKISIEEANTRLHELAEEKSVCDFTLNALFLFATAECLKARYKAKGYSEELYYDTMADILYKTNECIDVKGVPGTFVLTWYHGFYDMTRFALGRFQYEMLPFKNDVTTKSGRAFKEGFKTYNFHIPNTGQSLTDEVRLDSYKRAYEFFRDELTDGIMVFRCTSWLLDPIHYEILSPESNMVKFMNDFDMFYEKETSTFPDSWRVFGRINNKPIEEWPENTSLQRAYKKWLLAGKKTNIASGLFLFDGEKIIR